MKVGIVGFGQIGMKRAKSLTKIDSVDEIIVYEPHGEPSLSKGGTPQDSKKHIRFVKNLEELLNQNLYGVIVCTPHDLLAPYAEKLISRDLNLLIEKPGALTLDDLKRLAEKDHKNLMRFGFNYRFMPGVATFLDHVLNRKVGEIISLEFYLGHGGSPSDRYSWKLDPARSGGGVILDPGVHIVDILVNGLKPMGDFRLLKVKTWKGFWNTGIDEHASILGEIDNVNIQVTLSIVTWKTTFRIGALGTDGYFAVSGRGRSDGPQTSIQGKRWAWLESEASKFEEKRDIIMENDLSFDLETEAWISGQREIANTQEAIKAFEVVTQMTNSQC